MAAPKCIYQCINGQLELASDNCSTTCPDTAGPCTEEGALVSRPCPSSNAQAAEECEGCK